MIMMLLKLLLDLCQYKCSFLTTDTHVYARAHTHTTHNSHSLFVVQSLSRSRFSIFVQTFWAYLHHPAQVKSLGISKSYTPAGPKCNSFHKIHLRTLLSHTSPRLSTILLLCLFPLGLDLKMHFAISSTLNWCQVSVCHLMQARNLSLINSKMWYIKT